MNYDLMQIGAGSHDVGGCVDYAHLSRHSIDRAILIDPDRDALERLKVKCESPRRWNYVEGAVGEKDGIANLYCPVGKPASTSLDYEIARKHGEVTVREVSVFSCRSIVLGLAVSFVHTLIVDAEGLDGLIVREMLKVLPIIPRVIIWEYPSLYGDRITLMKELSAMGYKHLTLNSYDRLSVLS